MFKKFAILFQVIDCINLTLVKGFVIVRVIELRMAEIALLNGESTWFTLSKFMPNAI